MNNIKSCPCPCHKMDGIFLFLFGLNFLLKTLGVYEDQISNIIWPSIIMLAGLNKSFKDKCKCCLKKEN